MKKPREIFTADEEATVVVAGEEQTLVSPRFDDEETLVARHVVPLGGTEADVPRAPAVPAAPIYTRVYTRARRLPRGPLPLVLVLVCVLVGGVLGGAGLYLYQRQSGDTPATASTAVPAATTSQPEAPGETHNDAAQQSPTAEAVSPVPDAQPADAATNEPAAAEPNAPSEPADEGRASAGDTDAAPAREAESVPAAVTPKRGKKGDHDEEIQRAARRANRPDSDAPLSRADSPRPEARRVDTIFYRQRRVARDRTRRRAPDDAERLRRIFEGPPER